MSRGPALLRSRDRVAQPWKNGGGTTREIAAYPAGAGFDAFGWRLSMADVLVDGGFSSFPGIDRHLAILSGRMSLRIGERPEAVLGIDDPALCFAGDAPVFARPIDGAVRDLNLMVRRGLFRGQVQRRDGLDLRTDADTTILLAPAPIRLIVDGRDVALAAFDAVGVGPGTEARTSGRIMLAEIRRV